MIQRIFSAVKSEVKGAPGAALAVVVAFAFLKAVAWALDKAKPGAGEYVRGAVRI